MDTVSKDSPRWGLKKIPWQAIPVIIVFVGTFAVHFAVFDENRWPTGDEPHYLLTTISVLRDHDFDVSNQYKDRAWREFAQYDRLDSHCTAKPSGVCLMNHNLWFSALLAIPYGIAGLKGVEIFQISLLAAIAAQIPILVSLLLRRHHPVGYIGAAVFAFSAPAFSNSITIYPSLLGAALFLLALNLYALSLRTDRNGFRTAALFVTITAGYFHQVFIGAAFVAVALIWLLDRRKIGVLKTGLIVAYMSGWFWPYYLIGGNYKTGTASSAISTYTFSDQVQFHIANMSQGLLPNAPFTLLYFLLIAWILRSTFRKREIEGPALVAASIVSVVLMLYALSSQTPGESPILRYFMPILPIMVVLICWMAARYVSLLIAFVAAGAYSVVLGIATARSVCNVDSCHQSIEIRADKWLGRFSPYEHVQHLTHGISLVVFVAGALIPAVFVLIEANQSKGVAIAAIRNSRLMARTAPVE